MPKAVIQGLKSLRIKARIALTVKGWALKEQGCLFVAEEEEPVYRYTDLWVGWREAENRSIRKTSILIICSSVEVVGEKGLKVGSRNLEDREGMTQSFQRVAKWIYDRSMVGFPGSTENSFVVHLLEGEGCGRIGRMKRSGSQWNHTQ